MARLNTPAQSRAAARVTRRRVAIAAGVGAAFAVGLVVLVATPGPGSHHANPTAAGQHSGVPGANPTASSYVPPEHWVTLPAGASEVDQMPVGFPHTPLGAAALAAATVSYAWCDLPDQAARAASVYASPDQQQEAVTAATGLVGELRQQAGMPATGPLPDGAAVQAVPYAVQYTANGPDTVVVDVAFDLETTPATGQATSTRPVVVAATMAWLDSAGTGGDWRYTLTPTASTADYPTPAELGTAPFNRAGWLAIEGAGG